MVLNVELVIPTEEEDRILEQLDNAYTKVSEMTTDQRSFLNTMILRNKPEKLLEIGVSAGDSSVIMLNAITNFFNAKLYSIDLYEQWYKDSGKKTGYMERYALFLNISEIMETVAFIFHQKPSLPGKAGGLRKIINV
jgi:predicted O-methyltransferase YrrM